MARTEVLKTRVRRSLSAAPSRLYRAAPAVVLGILLNALDAVSTGLLVFPMTESRSGFSDLQVQGMSLYLMSTITSQVVMTLGGSLFPGALGSMLIEILPFLRGIATSIQRKLGDDDPSLIPTVLAAYSLTSFLTGAVFIALGALKCGRLVEYFPRTVLTGTIGAIGLSLFLLGLELTLPPTSPALTLSSARTILFGPEHLPLLFASILPTLFLSLSMRSYFLEKLTRGFTQHPLYVPVFVFTVAAIFWVVVAATGNAGAGGMAKLAAQGWFFTVEESVRNQSGIGTAWNYWKLFDFKKVEWSAMQGAIHDIVLLVLIGVLNLPIYIPALALALDVPTYGMNHEFLGHGASNILAGVVGTIPNLVVFSNSLFFTRAGGGRFEGVIVIILTFVIFLISSLILPYIPTLLASALVLFLGVELMIEAVWESTKALLWCEWSIVIGTLLACTFVGFAPGFGIGIALAMVIHLGWGVFDSRARVFNLAEMQQQYQLQPHHRNPYSRGTHITAASGSITHYDAVGGMVSDIETTAATLTSGKDADQKSNNVTSAIQIAHDVTIIRLSGYAFFATIPSLESNLQPHASGCPTKLSFIIVDLSSVHRLETSVVEFLERKSRELGTKEPPTTVVLCGVSSSSGAARDLQRGGINLLPAKRSSGADEKGLVAFNDIKEATEWCMSQQRILASSCHAGESIAENAGDHQSGPMEELSTAPESDLAILSEFQSCFLLEHADRVFDNLLLPGLDLVERVRAAGVRMKRHDPGDIILRKGDVVTAIVFVVHGRILLENEGHAANSPILRGSVKNLVTASLDWAGQQARAVVKRTLRHGDHEATERVSVESSMSNTEEILHPGDSFGLAEVSQGLSATWSRSERVVAAQSTPCVLLEVDASNADGIAWSTRAIALLQEKRNREAKMFAAQ